MRGKEGYRQSTDSFAHASRATNFRLVTIHPMRVRKCPYLWSRRELGDRLHESNAVLLVLLKDLQHCSGTRHSFPCARKKKLERTNECLLQSSTAEQSLSRVSDLRRFSANRVRRLRCALQGRDRIGFDFASAAPLRSRSFASSSRTSVPSRALNTSATLGEV